MFESASKSWKTKCQAGRNEHPKIVHRIYFPWNDAHKLSKQWQFNCYYSCQEDKYGFQLMVWDKNKILNFLREYYPWFLLTYYSYKRETQRTDAARYFILYHYGGLYLDMDISCISNLNSLYSSISKNNLGDIVAVETDPVGFSNAF